MRSTWINELKASASSMGDPSVPHSGWFLSQGGSHDGAQIGSASRQMMAPSVTWGESLSLSPSGRIFPGKRKWAGWIWSRRTGNRTRVSVPLHVSCSVLLVYTAAQVASLPCANRPTTFLLDLHVFLPNDTDPKQEFLHVTHCISYQQNMMEHLLDITREPLILVTAAARPRCVGVRCL